MSKLAKQVDKFVYGYEGLKGLIGEIVATFEIEQNQDKISDELKIIAGHWKNRYLKIVGEADDG